MRFVLYRGQRPGLSRLRQMRNIGQALPAVGCAVTRESQDASQFKAAEVPCGPSSQEPICSHNMA